MDKKIRVKDRPNIEEEMHRLFSGFAQMRNRILLHALNIWHPATDVCETDDELWIICEGVLHAIPRSAVQRQSAVYNVGDYLGRLSEAIHPEGFQERGLISRAWRSQFKKQTAIKDRL